MMLVDGFSYRRVPDKKAGAKVANFLNNITYEYWFNRIMEIACNAYEWSNLPDTVDERFLEIGLFSKGEMIYFNDEELGNLCLTVAVAGQFNMYQVPTQRRAYAVNGYQKQLSEKDSVLIYNNYLRIPTAYIADIYARRLADIDRTIEVNVQAQKTPVLLYGSEEMRLTLKNAYAQYVGNEPVIVADKDFDLKNIGVYKTDAPQVFTPLYELKKEVWSECLSVLGIENSISKKERLLSSEISANLGSVYAQRYTGLNARRQAADEINKMFGTNISVDYRQNTAPITLDGVTTTTEDYEAEVDREVQKGGGFGG